MQTIFDDVYNGQNSIFIEVQTISGGVSMKVGYSPFLTLSTSPTCLFVTLHGSRPKPLICPHELVQNSSEVCREKEKCQPFTFSLKIFHSFCPKMTEYHVDTATFFLLFKHKDFDMPAPAVRYEKSSEVYSCEVLYLYCDLLMDF